MPKDRFESLGYGQGQVPYGKRPAILVVDLQQGLVSHETAGGAPLILRAVQNCEQLLNVARTKKIPVIHTAVAWRKDLKDFGGWKHKCQDLLKHNVIGSQWVQPEASLWNESDILLEKKMPSAFFGTPLQQILTDHGIDTLIITGCTTSGCVRASIIDSFSHGFLSIVPEDCVGDQEQTAHDQNLQDIGRRYAQVTKSQEVIAHLKEFN